MDRLRRILASGTLAITMGTAAASIGCRSTGNEIPPQPKYATPGENSSAVGFNSAPHGYNGVSSVYGNGGIPTQPGLAGGGPAAGGPGGGPPSDGLPTISARGEGSAYGTPTPNTGNPTLPTSNAYGGPGTSGLAGGAGAGAYGGGAGAGAYGGGIGGR